MVWTMKEMIEDTTHVKLSANENITHWMIRFRAFRKNTHSNVNRSFGA